MEQNIQLRQAWDFVENTGRSVFLTGKAGTGKTTFLRTVVKKSSKQTIVLAPTGVAGHKCRRRYYSFFLPTSIVAVSSWH